MKISNTNDSTDKAPVFAYTSIDQRYPAAQKSMINYFGATDISQLNRIKENSYAYQPNGGMYGTNVGTDGSGKEGFSSFFSVSFSDLQDSITITPRAKTLLNWAAVTSNPQVSAVNYYAARGLVIKESSNGRPVSAYYPLKILIYDSCGDGFFDATYVCLEIRVYIGNSAPTLSDSLEDHEGLDGKKDGDKEISVSIAVGQGYSFSVSDVVKDNDLLTDDGGVFWKSTYNRLGEKITSNEAGVSDRFAYDTGDYLVSPYENYIAYRDTNAANTALRNGTAGFSVRDDNDHSSEPDIIMYMSLRPADLTNPKGASPLDDSVRFYVNRRTSLDNGETQLDFVFVLTFTDSSGNTGSNETNKLYIKIHVNNSAPSVRENKVVSTVRMRVNDSFTVLTTPFDDFYPGYGTNNASPSARNSYTVQNYGNPEKRVNINESLMNLYPDDTTFGGYTLMTSANLDTIYKLRDYNDKAAEQYIEYIDPGKTLDDIRNLGYTALATDDAPWGLRITRVVSRDIGKFEYDRCDRIAYSATSGSTNTCAMNYVFRAREVCDTTISFQVTDSEGASMEYAIHVIVESSKPMPITKKRVDDGYNELNAGLSFTDTDGTYGLYMVTDTGKGGSVKMQLADKNNTVVDAYGALTVYINNIAYDPDKHDNENIGLFLSDKDVPAFSMNGVPLEIDESGVYDYINDILAVKIGEQDKSFKITCIGYDRMYDEDVLTFYVKDYGNNVFAQAIPININITTLYSAMTNSHAASNTTPVDAGINNRVDRVDTVKVKSFDVYYGMGDFEDNDHMGEFSTYQFLSYADMPDSVDQNFVDEQKGAYIVDIDMLNHSTALDYDVYVYALMDQIDNGYNSKALTDLNTYFDVDKSNGYFRLRDRGSITTVGGTNLLIGGKRASGASHGNLNTYLLAYINQYFTFGIGKDGVSLTFKPVNATKDVKILFYVEVVKQTSSSRNTIQAQDLPIAAGTLFYVEVNDSAPLATTAEEVISFSGKVGDWAKFKIFDENDPLHSLFTDSDIGDYVSVNKDKFAIADALSGVDPAIDVTTNGAPLSVEINSSNVKIKLSDAPRETPEDELDENYNPDYWLEPHTLRVKIMRRVDAKDKDGNYLESYTLPLKIVGQDIAGEQSTVTLKITVENTSPTLDLADLTEKGLATKIDRFGVGYVISEGDNDYTYNLDAFVSRDFAALSINVVQLLSDPDFIGLTQDQDSFRLVVTQGEANSKKYIGDDKYVGKDDEKEIVEIEPTYYDHIKDKFHFTGITVSATTYMRGVYNGIAYLRVTDRSSIAKDVDKSVIFVINIHILNSAPQYVDESKRDTRVTVIGADSGDVDSIVFNIADYVKDPNPTDDLATAPEDSTTYLRIRNVFVEAADDVKSTSPDGSFKTDIVDYEYGEGMKSCTFKPVNGFYGVQRVNIVISDGDTNDEEKIDITVSITFEILYNIKDVTNLNTLTVVRGMSNVVKVESIVSDIENTFSGGSSDGGGGGDIFGPEQEVKTFNPGNDYAVYSLYAPNTYTDYVTVGKNNDGEWYFRGLSTGTITLKADLVIAGDADKENATVVSSPEFTVIIEENPRPQLIQAFKDGYIFYTEVNGQGGYTLNSENTVYLTPYNLFTDNERDIMKFVSVSSKTPSLVTATIVDENRLSLKFSARGDAEITVTVADTTEESVTYTFTARNLDLPSPSFWQNIKFSFETNRMLWLIIIGAVVLLIVILIIVIIALKRRKRKREELEAMLVSEMELEEQMMRLAAGQSSPYDQAFGFLPPTMGAMPPNPNMMIGAGPQGGAQNPNVLGLGQGQGNTPPAGHPGAQPDGFDNDF